MSFNGPQNGKGWGGGKPAASAPYGGIVLPTQQKGKLKGKEPCGGGYAKGVSAGVGKGSFGPGMSGKGGGGKPQGEGSHERDDAKIFVGGLPKTCGEEAISEYFSTFGPIVKIDLKMDPATGQSRGFGFVTFEEAFSAQAALGQYESHQIEGKWVEVKSAMVNGKPAPGQKGGSASEISKGGKAPAGPTESHKIFVGGLAKTTSEEAINAYFSEFGFVTEVMLKKDRETGESKGFAFVSFEDEVSVATVLNNYAENQIEGKWVEVKQAAEKGGAPGPKGGKGAPAPSWGGKALGGKAQGYAPAKGGKMFKGWSPY